MGGPGGRLVDQFEYGLDAPICLTWELTYACNLACVHCLSSSGQRDPRELTTDECKALIDELERMQVFYVNIGGGEPTVRPDFWELLDYAVAHHVGVKFSTNGVRITPSVQRLAATDYVDIQISLDVPGRGQRRRPGPGHVRHGPARDGQSPGRRHAGLQALGRLHPSQRRSARRVQGPRGRVRRPVAADPAAAFRPRRRRLGRAAPQPTSSASSTVAHRPRRRGLTGDSFFHLSAYGEALPGSTCAARDGWSAWSTRSATCTRAQYAIHDQFLAGNLREDGGFDTIWKAAPLFLDLRSPQTGGACTQCSAYDSCRGGCMAAKFFTGLPLDGPDPECVKGNSETALAGDRARPGSSQDHSRTGTVRNAPVPLTLLRTRPVSACDASPLVPAMTGDLGRTTWPESGGRPLLLVPVGSVSEHGPALPLTTDTIVAEAVTREAAARLRSAGRSVLVAPAVAYGASGEHEDFAGTVSIGHLALGAVLVELGRSASRWASGVVFVNGHGGNASTVASAVDLLRAEGRAASWAACAAGGPTRTPGSPRPRSC